MMHVEQVDGEEAVHLPLQIAFFPAGGDSSLWQLQNIVAATNNDLATGQKSETQHLRWGRLLIWGKI
jgi:hypothetical protein